MHHLSLIAVSAYCIYSCEIVFITTFGITMEMLLVQMYKLPQFAVTDMIMSTFLIGASFMTLFVYGCDNVVTNIFICK